MPHNHEREQTIKIPLRLVDKPTESETLAAERSHRRGVVLHALERELFQGVHCSQDDVNHFCDTHRLDAEHITIVRALTTTFMDEVQRSNWLHDQMKSALFPGRTDEPSPQEWGLSIFQHRTGEDTPSGTITFTRIGPFFSMACSSADDFVAFVKGRQFFAEEAHDVRGVMSTDMIRLSLFQKDNVPLLIINEEIIADDESDTMSHELQHAMNMLYIDGRNPELCNLFSGKKASEQHGKSSEKKSTQEEQQKSRDAIKDELLARIRSGKNPLYMLNMLYVKQYRGIFSEDKGLQLWVQHIRNVVKDSVNELRQFLPLFQSARVRGIVVNQLIGVALEDFPATLRRMKAYYSSLVAEYVQEENRPVRSKNQIYPTRVQRVFQLMDQERQQYLRQIGEIVVEELLQEPINLSPKTVQLDRARSKHRNIMDTCSQTVQDSFPYADQPHAWVVDTEQMRRSATDIKNVPWATDIARSIVDVLDSWDYPQLHALAEQALQSTNSRHLVMDDASLATIKEKIAKAVEHVGSNITQSFKLANSKFFITSSSFVVECIVRDNQTSTTEVGVRVTYQFDGSHDASFWDEDFV